MIKKGKTKISDQKEVNILITLFSNILYKKIKQELKIEKTKRKEKYDKRKS